MALGARGIHESLMQDGMVSQAMIVQKQPSMSEPIDKGLPYTIVRWPLSVACPCLMEVLSRTGNTEHGSHRQQTVLQGIRRCHALALAMQKVTGRNPDWEAVAKQAAKGMGPIAFSLATGAGWMGRC